MVWSLAVSGDDFSDWGIGEQHIISKPVNEGTLQFLDITPEEAVHHHQNTITIEPTSLRHGWVRLKQCHHHLDPVARTDIVFKGGHVRELKLVDYSGIEAVSVSEARVEMLDVRRDAWICLKVQSKALEAKKDGHYTLRMGPYMRRFLDGYFPMRLTMAVHYPCDLLRVSDIEPRAQVGFRIKAEACKLLIDALFLGRLNPKIQFLVKHVRAVEDSKTGTTEDGAQRARLK